MRMGALAAVLVSISAAPLGAQNVHDVAAYFGTAFSTAIESPRVEQPMLGDSVNVWGLHPFYTRQSANYWGVPDPFGAFGVSGFGGSISSSFFTGRLGLEAMGGYYAFSCDPGVSCKGGFAGGGSALYRLLRAPMVFRSGSRLTVSLRSGAAWSGAGRADYKYASVTAGLPIALSAPAGAYRVVGFLTPGITWASLKALRLVYTQFGTLNIGSFEHDGTAGLLSGGLGLIPSANGIGVSLGFQRVFVRRARTEFGATLTWNRLRLGGSPREQ